MILCTTCCNDYFLALIHSIKCNWRTQTMLCQMSSHTTMYCALAHNTFHKFWQHPLQLDLQIWTIVVDASITLPMTCTIILLHKYQSRISSVCCNTPHWYYSHICTTIVSSDRGCLDTNDNNRCSIAIVPFIAIRNSLLFVAKQYTVRTHHYRIGRLRRVGRLKTSLVLSQSFDIPITIFVVAKGNLSLRVVTTVSAIVVGHMTNLLYFYSVMPAPNFVITCMLIVDSAINFNCILFVRIANHTSPAWPTNHCIYLAISLLLVLLQLLILYDALWCNRLAMDRTTMDWGQLSRSVCCTCCRVL